MRILLSVQHPAWAHQFRYVIHELEERGYTVKVVAVNKDRSLELLDTFKIKYDVISSVSGNTIIEKGLIFLKTTWKIFWISRKFKPDIFIGRASPMMAINSYLFKKKHIVFDDTERANLCLFFAKLFSDVIITPDCFRKDLGRKHLRIEAYKELFYLHPHYFTPDPAVLRELGLTAEEKYVILRFVAWDAYHDIGQKGITANEKKGIVKELENYGRVFISSEGSLPEGLEPYRLTTPLEKIHDVLYYATLFFSDGGTMTTEAAVLGTPAIRTNSFVGSDDMGNFLELEERYELIYNFRKLEQAIQKAIELLSRDDTKAEWQKKRENMLAGKLDATQVMVDIIDKYAECSHGFKE